MLFAHTLYEGFGVLVMFGLFLIVFCAEMIQRADKNGVLKHKAKDAAMRGGLELFKHLTKK
jgi:hypothetical protein